MTLTEIRRQIKRQIDTADPDTIDAINAILNPSDYEPEYSPYRCNHTAEQRRAESASTESLLYMIIDAAEAAAAGGNPEKYLDQISIYRKELLNRM